MKLFEEKESYLHKHAKQVLKEWLIDGSDGNDVEFKGRINNGEIQKFFFRPNRSENKENAVYLEYPLGIKPHNTWQYLWDEQHKPFKNGNIPTFDECIDIDKAPFAILDLVILHKGSIGLGIEVCHKNQVSNEKRELLKRHIGSDFEILEVNATWIMSQIEKPDVIEFQRKVIGRFYNNKNMSLTYKSNKKKKTTIKVVDSNICQDCNGSGIVYACDDVYIPCFFCRPEG
jgi:hypothetical protein